MNFSDFLERNRGTIEEYRKDKKIEDLCIQKIEKQRISNIDKDLKDKYDALREKFRNYREIWTEDEIETVYLTLDGVSKKDMVNMMLKTAISLERTKNAVSWMHLHLFSERTDLHRGNQVIQFRKQVGLEKGVENVIT